MEAEYLEQTTRRAGSVGATAPPQCEIVPEGVVIVEKGQETLPLSCPAVH